MCSGRPCVFKRYVTLHSSQARIAPHASACAVAFCSNPHFRTSFPSHMPSPERGLLTSRLLSLPCSFATVVRTSPCFEKAFRGPSCIIFVLRFDFTYTTSYRVTTSSTPCIFRNARLFLPPGSLCLSRFAPYPYT